MGTMGTAMMTSAGASIVEQGKSQGSTLSLSGVFQSGHRILKMLLRPQGHLLAIHAAAATTLA